MKHSWNVLSTLVSSRPPARLARRLGWIGAATLALPALALEPGDPVENFELPDYQGETRELYASRDAKAIVLMVQGNGCPIVRQNLPALAEVRDAYAEKGVEFMLFNPNLQDTPELIAEEAEEFEIDFPILVDAEQTVGEFFDVERTADVFLIDPSDWTLLYRGPVDDRVSYERARPVARNAYLLDALEAMFAGEPVPQPQVPAEGCLVNFPMRDVRLDRVTEHVTETQGWAPSDFSVQRESVSEGVVTFAVFHGTGEAAAKTMRIRVDLASSEILTP